MAFALAIITDTQGNIFLQHRDGKAPTNPNIWGLWGGGVHDGETPKAALKRELREELNIDVDLEKVALFKPFQIQLADGYREGHVFNVHDEGQFAYELHEGNDMRYFTPTEIAVLDVDPLARAILTEWFARQQ